MKKKSLSLLIIVIVIVAVSISFFVFVKNKNSPSIRGCPDEWIENRMPSVEGDNSERQYFIFDGKRKEIKNYDLDWIKSSCSVKVQYVY